MEKVLSYMNPQHNGKNLCPNIFLTAANIISTFLSPAAQLHSGVLYIGYFYIRLSYSDGKFAVLVPSPLLVNIYPLLALALEADVH